MFLANYTITTPNDFRTTTSISDQIEDSILQPYLLISEEQNVYEILGEPLVESLKMALTGVTATTQLDYNTQLLIQHIIPVASYGAWHELIHIMAIKLSNMGEIEQSPANGTNADLQKIVFKQKGIKAKVNHYQQRLQKFLDSNAVNYPLYRSACNNTYDDSTGFYLGDYA